MAALCKGCCRLVALPFHCHCMQITSSEGWHFVCSARLLSHIPSLPDLMLPVSHSIFLVHHGRCFWRFLSNGLKNLYDGCFSCSCMLRHKPWRLGCKATRNVVVRATHVPWDWKLLGHLDLVLECGLCWELVLWAFGRGPIRRLFFFAKHNPKSSTHYGYSARIAGILPEKHEVAP